jgi:hypothetical protein
LEANFDKRVEAVVGPMKDTQGNILNRIIAHNAERKFFEWHTDGKRPKKIMDMFNFNDRTKGASMTGTKDDGAKLRDGAPELEGQEKSLYSSAAGTMLHHALDRPDTQLATGRVMQCVTKPTVLAEARMKYLARHIHTHPQVVWIFEQQGRVDDFTTITDALWAMDADTRRSVDCLHIFLGGHFLEISTCTQHLIAVSTAECEFYGITRGAACWLQLRELLMGMGLKMKKVRVRTDSSAAKGVVKRSGSGKMKHMAAKHRWIQEVGRQGIVDVTTIDTLHNTANLGNKYHPERRLQELLQMMPVAIGFDLVPGSVRRGLFLASLLNGVNAAKGQREEGTNYEKMNEYVMSFITVAFVIAVILMYVTQLRPTRREVGAQATLDEEQAISMHMLMVAELKRLCVRERVQLGHGATRAGMIALLITTRTR